jgi:branched-chain amino acid aminotransferase
LDFGALDECFLLSTTKDITPVGAIDDAVFAVGPDSVTSRLKAEFGKTTDSYAASYPDLAV